MIWMGGVVAVFLLLALVGAIYEPIAEAADAKAYPPPGKMVDVWVPAAPQLHGLWQPDGGD
jgi:hypothetical protein